MRQLDASKLSLRAVSREEAEAFMDESHVAGFKSASFWIGLAE